MKRSLEQLKKDLSDVLETMDVPEKRKTDYRWLLRNLLIKNDKHPKSQEALEILMAIFFKEVREKNEV